MTATTSNILDNVNDAAADQNSVNDNEGDSQMSEAMNHLKNINDVSIHDMLRTAPKMI